MGLTDINSVRREKDDEEADSDERDQLQFSNGSSVSEIRRFEIAFDRPEGLYFSGDCVSGEVQISLEDTIHVKGVVVRFVGEAYVNVPAEEDGTEGPVKGATWQKRCKNLKTLATMGRRNKIKPSASGMSNHGFAAVEPKDSSGKEATPAPLINGGHAVKSETSEDAREKAEEQQQPPSKVEDDIVVTDMSDGPTENLTIEHTKLPMGLETVKEEDDEEDSGGPLEEVRLVEDATPVDEGPPAEVAVTTGEDVKEAEVQESVVIVELKVEEKPPDIEKPSGNEVKKIENDKIKTAVDSSGKKVPGAATTRRPSKPLLQPTDQNGNNSSTKKRGNPRIRSHEKYFDYKFYVFGHKYSSAREHLSSGAHRFRFSYVLPGKLPSSFHGKYGYVRYYCEASLERAWAPSITRKAMYSVNACVDVNREPRAESGAGGHRSTHGCLFCCPRGTVMAEAGVRRRGFVPGERIPLRAHILNVSDRSVKRTRARLLQVVTYHSNNASRSKVDEVLVTEAVRGEVPRGEADTWDEECGQKVGSRKGSMIPQPPVSLEIPPLPANFKCSEYCKIIDVDYRLDFMVEVEGESEPLHIRMPIVVGTVPLERVFRTMEMGPRRRSTASAAEKLDGTAPIIIPGSSQYVEFPLPRYEPCNWGPRHVEAYFHHEVIRKLSDDDDTTPTSEGAPGIGGTAAKAAKSVTPVATAGALPGIGATLRVHRKGETFAPKYVCYTLKDPDIATLQDGASKIIGARSSVGGISLSPLSPGHLKAVRSPSEAWIPRDTSETELMSPGSGPSKEKRP